VLSDKPQDGYDAGTLAADLVAEMDALGPERFALIGHDTEFTIGYALAADHPERVARRLSRRSPGHPGPRRHHRCSSPRRSTTGSGTCPSTASRPCPNS
jgi:pimeloyl-ACP methyl ester carboxylesterase